MLRVERPVNVPVLERDLVRVCGVAGLRHWIAETFRECRRQQRRSEVAEAGAQPTDGVYGVWASRSAGTGVRATQGPEGWRLTGQVRFASGIDVIDRVLLPGWVDDRTHLLFDIATDATPSPRPRPIIALAMLVPSPRSCRAGAPRGR